MNYLNQAERGKTDIWRSVLVISMILFLSFSKTYIQRVQEPLVDLIVKNFNPFSEIHKYTISYYSDFLIKLVILIPLILFLHRRSFLSFLTSHKKFRFFKLFLTMFIYSFFSVLLIIAEYIYHPHDFTFTFKFIPFLQLFVLTMFLVPIKALFIDLFLRGYILQTFAIFIKNRIGLILIGSILYIFVYLNNISENYISIHMLFFVIILSLFFNIIILLNDGLEVSLGLFFMNNFLITIIAYFDWNNTGNGAILTYKPLEPNVFVNYYLPTLIYLMFIVLMIKIFRIDNWKEKLTGKISQT